MKTSPKGPELSHIEAGLARAQQLGMTITMNPFVSPEDFAFWRGTWNPNGRVRSNFWRSYQEYLIEVATLAQAYQVKRMTVGTELKALTANTAHNTYWQTLIEAVATIYQGALGYALQNRSNVVGFERRLQEAEREVARAKGETGVTASLIGQ